jgi:hypothetical protein
MREVSTSEALMTDPTTPEGAAYWQERHDLEGAVMDQEQELRDLLEAVLDPRTSPTERRNAIYLLIQDLQALDQALASEEAMPNETT